MSADASSIRVTGDGVLIYFVMLYKLTICSIVRVRPFTNRETTQVAPDEAPFFVGDGSLTATPRTKLAAKTGIRKIINVIDERVLVFDPPDGNPVARFQKTLLPTGKRVKDLRYAFDHIFDDNASQEEVCSCAMSIPNSADRNVGF